MDYPIVPNPVSPIFDSHTHYTDERFDRIREELLSRLPEFGVSGAIVCGWDADSSRAALKLAREYDFLYAAVGIHPENLDGDTSPETVEALASHPKCVAIGEIGLDYYWDDTKKSEQCAVFEQQLILANKIGLPVIVHDREAHADTLDLLKKHRPRGVVHCFSGSPEMAAEILKIGMYIGVGGSVTFKNARRLPETVAGIPLDRILVETDCPYLAPEPFRGKICHSGLIAATAEKIAEIRGSSVTEILEATNQNAKKLFGI